MRPEDARLIGASDVSSVLQVSDWSGWVSLWARCTGRYAWQGNAVTRQGQLSEAYHRALYTADTGFELELPPVDEKGEPIAFRHPLLPWARCSPDATALGTPEGRRGVELKQSRRSDAWAEGVPSAYWLQAQMQGGFLTEVGYWDSADVDVSALVRGDRATHPVAHEPEAWERIQEACGRFWADFVVADRCPEPMEGGERVRLFERDVQALLACFPAPGPDTPLLAWDDVSEADRRLLEQWRQANDARKRWADEEEAIGAQVRHLLLAHPGVTGPLVDGRPAWRVDFKQGKNGRPLVGRGGRE